MPPCNLWDPFNRAYPPQWQFPKDGIWSLETLRIVFSLYPCIFRIAFSLPSINIQKPALRYQWVILPQGLDASSSICQMYVAACLDPLRRKFSSFHIIHDMDDILLTAPTKEESLLMFAELQTLLEGHGFILAPEKVQMQPPYSFFFQSLLNYESFHFRPSSQHPPTLPLPLLLPLHP